jgi:hypothetical protein
MRLEPSPNARQAALTLHAMAPHDVAWLLQQLPAIEAAELQSLLEELHDLGIPSDPRLLDELRLGDAVPPQSALASYAHIDELSVEALVHALDTARVDLLLPVLKPEPVALLAFLLSLRSWSWADSLLAALETHRRLSLRLQVDSLVAKAGAVPCQAAQLEFALLRRLLQRYRSVEASESPQTAASAHPGGFARWWQERRRFWSSIIAPMRIYK